MTPGTPRYVKVDTFTQCVGPNCAQTLSVRVGRAWLHLRPAYLRHAFWSLRRVVGGGIVPVYLDEDDE